MPELSFHNVWFAFNDKTVIEGMSFRIPSGEHTVLKGESGSGKSTILKLLLQFIEPGQGSITWNTDDQEKNIRPKTAWLPQDLNIGTGTVRNVIEHPFEFTANNSNKPTNNDIESTLKELALNPEILDQQYSNLSTGQRQRVGIALCHLLNKSILLLDEPTSALDKASKERISNLLLAHTNKTIVSTSHDPFWVAKADHIIELS
jgi:ABC-type multidrug transport system ATPase subunit